MALAQPVPVTQPAWKAIRDEVVAPARAGGSPAVARLADAWEEARPGAGGQVVVWLDPEQAAALAELLDGRPELAGHLAGDPG